MLDALREFISVVGKFFLGIFAKQPIQVEPTPPITGTVTTPVTGTGTKPAPTGFHQSKWWQATYPITQQYGCTAFAEEGHNPFHPECEYFHEGIDFALPCGTPIYAGSYSTIGAVDPAGYGPVGNTAAIQVHFRNHDIWLYHMNDYAVHSGQHVIPGQLIGHSGTRGYSTGCHIHFEVRPINAAYRHSVDPTPWLLHPEIA